MLVTLYHNFRVEKLCSELCKSSERIPSWYLQNAQIDELFPWYLKVQSICLFTTAMLLLFSCSVVSKSAIPWTAACQASVTFTISWSLLPSSPFAFTPSQHQSLFQWAGSLHQVAKVLQPQHQSFQWIFRTDFSNYTNDGKLPTHTTVTLSVDLVSWGFKKMTCLAQGTLESCPMISCSGSLAPHQSPWTWGLGAGIGESEVGG